MKPLLEVTQLLFARGNALLLDRVDWRVERGQHWAIVGPNGCGKTTLLRSLTGYLSASSGSISLLGKRYGEADWRELRRRIGLVTSALQSSIPPAETALETVISGKYAQLDLWVKPTAGDVRLARRWLRHVGLPELESRPWLYLSQGERQRVLIARALMARPRLLILDEPCGGLDPVAREDFLQFLQQVGAGPESPALVLVTHHVDEIMPVFSHALVLREGKVVASGPRRAALTTAILSHAFGRPVRLVRTGGGRLRLDVTGAKDA